MPQIYEDYWNLTLAWTDFNGKKFIDTLKLVIDFIDSHKNQDFSEKLYASLQQIVQKHLKIEAPSVRKGINELVKLGFITPFLKSYHPLSKNYLESSLDDERKLILSKIIYSNSSFKRSVTTESSVREINFVVKTIEHVKSLHEKYLGVIISIDINEYPEGYISKEKLERLYRDEDQAKFEERKYNQIGYLKGLLKKLDGILYISSSFSLETDIEKVRIENIQETKGRDSYLQRLYKQQLQKESQRVFGKVKCMVERLEYPVLIASHIKPYRDSNDDEAFDPNNGLLLSKTLDSLFDLNYISFEDDGTIIFYSRVPEDVKQFWRDYRLDNRFITPERLTYLAYHRDICEHKS